MVMDSKDPPRIILLPARRDGERRAEQYTCGFLSQRYVENNNPTEMIKYHLLP